MTVDIPEEKDIAAAEYVLGLLRGEDKAAFERSMATDPELRDAVGAWEQHFATVAASIAPMDPPAGLWTRIERTLHAQSNAAAEIRPAVVDQLRHRLRLWRYAAVTATAAALALVLVVAGPWTAREDAAGGALTAVLDSPDRPSAWVVSASDDARAFSVTAVKNPTVTPGREFELWVIERPGVAPVSLGVIGRSNPTVLALAEPRRRIVAPGVTLAVSIEPTGGSPTGAPTGPVVFTGALVRTGGSTR